MKTGEVDDRRLCVYYMQIIMWQLEQKENVRMKMNTNPILYCVQSTALEFEFFNSVGIDVLLD